MSSYARRARQAQDAAMIERAGLVRDEYGYCQQSSGITIHALDDSDNPQAKWIVEDEGCREHDSGDLSEYAKTLDEAIQLVLSFNNQTMNGA